MVVDARCRVTFHSAAAADELRTEILYPERHHITLPLNGLNILFDSHVVAFNHHTKLDSDR